MLRLFAALVALLILVACGAPAATGETATDAPLTMVAEATTVPTTAPVTATAPPAPTEAPTSTPPPPEPPTITPAQESAAPLYSDVTFGKPLVIKLTGTEMSQAYIPVTNNGENVKSFTARATWKNGDQIAATASGAINDLQAGQTRVLSVHLMEPIPENGEPPKIDVDTMILDAASTPGADVANKVTFGPPKVSSTAGLTQLDVEVTNGDDKSHSMSVQAVFMKGDELAAVGTGAVNDLAPGQTKTATLVVQGNVEGAEPKVMVDTLIQ